MNRTFHLLLLFIALSLLATPLRAAQSDLSHWLSDEALPQLTEILSSHPRFAGEPVAVVIAGDSGLDEALATVITGNLAAHRDIHLRVLPVDRTQRLASVESIDALDCAVQTRRALLRVHVTREGSRRGGVVVELSDVAPAVDEAGAVWRRWQWQGAFSQHEREALSRAATQIAANGSLSLPWPEDGIAEAAAALTRELACDLRSQVRDRVLLSWRTGSVNGDRTVDVFNASQHLLGSLREVDVQALNVAQGGEFSVETRVQPFSDGVLQLWLVGTPLRDGFSAVQAVTYIRGTVASAAPVLPATVSSRLVAPEVPPAKPARDFLDVHMLEATQSDGAFSSADLSVQLRLVNRGTWPIKYAFSLSGGHFLHCIAKPENFRHDRYGYVEGQIAPGASLVRVIDVPGVKHSPHPWFGPRRCAGFRDLEGFENFPGKGYKVTELLRWDL